MSVEVITWAFAQAVPRSSAKFVLVAMANCAGVDGVCYPSMAYLSEATGQDRKTVAENIKRLKEDGFIEATGDHRGATNQVVVYRLNTNKAAQKRNGSENGTVPKTDTKTPENGHKDPRKRTEPPPKTGHGTVRNRQEPSGTKDTAPKCIACDVLTAEGFDGDTAAEFIAHKARMKAPLTPRAWADHLREAAKAGWSPMAAAEKVMAKSWRGFEAKYVANEARPGLSPLGLPAEPAWRTEQRTRNEAFLGPAAASRRQQPQRFEVIDADAKALG